MDNFKWLSSKHLFSSLVLLIAFVANGQTYSRFYTNNQITAQIRAQGYKNNGVYPEHIYIKNKTNTALTITGYMRIRFTEILRNGDRGDIQYKVDTFSCTVPPCDESKVNDYFNPDLKNGVYEAVGFYIDEIKERHQSTSQEVGYQKLYFSELTTFHAEDATNKQTVTFNTDGTCQCIGWIYTDSHWLKGTSNGIYHIKKTDSNSYQIYTRWDEWLSEIYNVSNNKYQNGGLLFRKQ